MKNRTMMLAGTLMLVAVLGKFYVPPLLAQARAALVKNVDEPGRTPYQALQVRRLIVERSRISVSPLCRPESGWWSRSRAEKCLPTKVRLPTLDCIRPIPQ